MSQEVLLNIENNIASVRFNRPEVLNAMNEGFGECLIDISQTLIIEDSKTGLLSAVKSKAHVIGITTSLTKDQIKDIDKNITVVNSYHEINKIFS